MESKEQIKQKVYKILDELIEINESILYTVGYGYTQKTLDGLKKFKSTLKNLEKELKAEQLADYLKIMN